MIKIAELKFKVLADLKSLQADIKKLFKEKFKIGVEGDGGGNTEGKKQTGVLDSILGKVVIIAGIVKTLQPILDILKLLLSFVFFQIAKTISSIKEGIPAFINSLANLFLAGLPFALKTLGTFIVSKLGPLLSSVKDRLVELKLRFTSKISELRDRFVASIKALPDKLKDFFDSLGTKLGEIKDDIVDSIVALPGFIWDAIKGLAQLIADKLKAVTLTVRNVIGSFFGFGGGDSVNDAIITKDGKVIKTNPNDTIIATQNPGGLGGGITNNFFGVQPQSFIDEVKRQLSTDQNRNSRF